MLGALRMLGATVTDCRQTLCSEHFPTVWTQHVQVQVPGALRAQEAAHYTSFSGQWKGLCGTLKIRDTWIECSCMA